MYENTIVQEKHPYISASYAIQWKMQSFVQIASLTLLVFNGKLKDDHVI